MKMKRMTAIVLCMALVLALMPGMSAMADVLCKLGDRGDRVQAVQARLTELGYSQTETDGVFGEGTQRAV